MQLDFYEPVVHYVNELITKDETKHRKYNCTGDECWTISVAGHSLGGGIASIVGSTLGISVRVMVRWGLGSGLGHSLGGGIVGSTLGISVCVNWLVVHR